MKIKSIKFALLILLMVSPLPLTSRAAEQPASGMPGNARFGYGVRVDLQGIAPARAIQLANSVNLDWVAVDFDWRTLQPNRRDAPHWKTLDTTLKDTESGRIAVMVSITNPPDWALKQDGPDPQAVARLAIDLVQRYPNTVLALELFPHANTRQGWGAPPNPQAYVNLLRVVCQSVQKINPQTVIVAAGLTPVESNAQDITDTVFLDRLYRSGAGEYMSIVGMRLPSIGSDPLTAEGASRRTTLRHYEAIREVMVRNGYRNSLIWITSFSWDAKFQRGEAQQANWLEDAYLLMRAQLYIGAAFFDGLNPSAGKTALLHSGSGHHSGFDSLVKIIAQEYNSQTIFISVKRKPQKSSHRNP